MNPNAGVHFNNQITYTININYVKKNTFASLTCLKFLFLIQTNMNL